MHMVFSSYRAGSKSFCAELSKELFMAERHNRKEWFSPYSGENWITRFRRLTKHRSRDLLMINVMVTHLPKYFESNGTSFKEVDALLAIGKSAYFVSRKNFDAACKSYTVASVLDSWGPTDTWEGVKTINYTQCKWEQDIAFMKKCTILLARLYHYVKASGIRCELNFLEDRKDLFPYSGREYNLEPYNNREYKFNMLEGEMATASLDVAKLFESRKYTDQCWQEYK